MPGNLFLMFVGWLATHLVLLSLLGFVVAGAFVFGFVELPSGHFLQGPSQTTAARTAPPAPAAEPVPPTAPRSPSDRARERDVAPAREASVGPRSDAPAALLDSRGRSDPDPVGGETGRRTPKLIGGSIPVYADPRMPPGRGAPGPDGFRPAYEPAAPAAVVPTRDEQVQAARRAFWNGDFERAEAAYMDVISRFPEDADLFGELGNLYVAMGNGDLALDAYYEAALRLQAEGQTERLGLIADLLRKEGDARADQLGP